MEQIYEELQPLLAEGKSRYFKNGVHQDVHDIMPKTAQLNNTTI
jgi:hypothetical protein